MEDVGRRVGRELERRHDAEDGIPQRRAKPGKKPIQRSEGERAANADQVHGPNGRGDDYAYRQSRQDEQHIIDHPARLAASGSNIKSGRPTVREPGPREYRRLPCGRRKAGLSS